MSQARRILITRGPGGLPGLDAHLGAWTAFDEAGLTPSIVCGTSAGAIISAFQAAGHQPSACSRLLRSLRKDDVVKKRWGWMYHLAMGTHWLDPAPIKQLLATWLPESWGDLKLPFAPGVTCMECEQSHGALEHDSITQSMRLREAVLASMSIYGVWPEVESEYGYRYSDGGTTCPFPMAASLQFGDLVIAVQVTRTTPFEKRDENCTSRLLWNVEMFQRAAEAEALEDLQEACAVVGAQFAHLELRFQDLSSLSFSDGHSLIDSAYVQARHFIQANSLDSHEATKPRSDQSIKQV